MISFYISVVPALDLTKQPETVPPDLVKLVEAIEQTGNMFHFVIDCHVEGFIVCGLFIKYFTPDSM